MATVHFMNRMALNCDSQLIWRTTVDGDVTLNFANAKNAKIGCFNAVTLYCMPYRAYSTG